MSSSLVASVGKTFLSALPSSSLSSSPFCLRMLFPSNVERFLNSDHQIMIGAKVVMHCWSCWSWVSCRFGCISITWARPLFPFLQRVCKTPGNSTKIHLAFCQSNQGQDLKVILGCLGSLSSDFDPLPSANFKFGELCTGQHACGWWLWDKVAQGA